MNPSSSVHEAPLSSQFLFFNPNRGWRRVGQRDSRTCINWAEDAMIRANKTWQTSGKRLTKNDSGASQCLPSQRTSCAVILSCIKVKLKKNKPFFSA